MARRRARGTAESRPTTATASLRPVKRGGLWQLVDAKLRPIRDANRFFAALAMRGLSRATIRAYGYDLVVLYRWLDRVGYAVRDLSGEKLLEYIGSQRAAGAQPTSINRRLTTARLLYRFCVGRDLDGERGVVNPAPYYRGPGRDHSLGLHPLPRRRRLILRVKVPRRVVEPLTSTEVRQFLRTLRRHRDVAIAHLMLLCGVRCIEVLQLQMGDVLVEEQQLRIRGKGQRERVLPLPKLVARSIADYARWERPSGCTTERLFVILQGPRRGNPMTMAGLRSLFRQRRRDRAIARANPHRFRHTFGADMARSGVRLPILQRLMGHADSNTTLRYTISQWPISPTSTGASLRSCSAGIAWTDCTVLDEPKTPTITATPARPVRTRGPYPRTVSKLPLATRRFLLTPRGQRARAAILTLHRWLEWRGISVAQLTPVLFQHFLTRPNHVRVTAKTSRALWVRLRDYLQRLRDRDMLSFNPKHLQRRPRSLPPVAREYLASLAPTHRRSTCGSYAVSLRNFYVWLDQNKLDIAQLTHRDMTRWFQALHAERLAVITRHGMLMETRVYLRWLNERQPMRTAADELIRRSDFPKLPRYMPRPLTVEADRELQRRLAASEDPLAWALLLMRRTGLRIGELYNLEYHCARFDRRQPLLKVPLGKLHSERLVPLDPDAVELVRRLQSTGPRSRAWLVPGRNHNKCNWDELSDVLKVASRDLPDPARITSRRLRHTFATELLSGGMSLVGVMRLLGHQDIRMTLRYAAVTPEIVAEEYQNALDKLATKYRLPPAAAAAPPEPEGAPDPDQLLDHLARWVRKHATPSPRDLLRRIERLRRDVQTVTPPTKK